MEQRNRGIDLLRMTAMWMVVILHILNKGGVLAAAAPLSAGQGTARLLETAAYCAVNCYGLISGYVGVQRRFRYSGALALPVRVQGAEAPPEIAGAIRYADKWKIGDVIITGRGGGSMEDLWAFNDERVARAIYACETPVISAVGHEPDVTISDFVADARASTPSNAAEIAVPDQVELRRQLSGLAERMTGSETSRLQALRERVDALGCKRVLTDQLAYVQDKRMELLHLQQRLGDLANAEIARKQKTFTALAASLDAMSPLKVLGRGYAVARNEAGQVLKSSGETHIGERIHITLGSGGLTAVVDHIEEARNGG